MVTSSAVVGSSAISSSGSQASAMAIITRWRMPPDSWCGILVDAQLAAPGCAPARSISIARSRASASADAAVPLQRLGDLRADACSTGLSEVIGSWKIMADLLAAQVLRSPARAARAGRRPSKRIEPATVCPGGSGTRRMMDSAVTLLPQPDSPTIASVVPASTANETPSTALNRPWPVLK